MATPRDTYFPKSIQLAAQHSQKKYGVPACVTLAQWALESAYGRYLSGRNNPFGIKGKGRVVTTWEVYGGKKVVIKAEFQDFATMEEAFDHHGKMLMRPDGFYTRAHQFAHSATWRQFIRAIAPTYATDPAYARKLEAIVDRFGLHYLNLAEPA